MKLPFGRKKRRRRARVDGPLRWRQFFGLFLLFTAFAVGIGFLAAQLERESEEAEGSASSGASAAVVAPEATPTPEATTEGSVAVGGLRLRIAGVDGNFAAGEFDPGSTVSTRIEVDLTNEGDSPLNVSAFEFALLDSVGTGHEISPCEGCPDSLQQTVTLEPGETGRGSLYYDLPPGSEPLDLRYRSRESGNDVVLAIVLS
ncbi:MAG: DUF4352 domain-containing protein [Dehalococcoidia bacterium]|nr:DUF4352 domain-containing protein [Dehalococcoidia bacterium]